MTLYLLIKRFFRVLPPPAAMVFTREPLMQRFWGSGVLFMVTGFGLGLWLWLQQQGWPVAPSWLGDSWQPRSVHAGWQVIYFSSAFLLGFALQAGPHLLGSPPPPLLPALRLLGLLLLGWLLSWIPDATVGIVSQLVTAASLLWAVGLLVIMVRSGLPAHMAGIGLPLAAGIAWLAVAVWLPLEQPRWGMWALWLGPMTVILAAAQQLIANVLGGQRLVGRAGVGFALLLTLCWGLTTLAAVADHDHSWRLAGLIWLITLLWYWVKTNLWQALRQTGWQSITLALACGLTAPLLTALWLLLAGGVDLDRMIHLLALGAVVPLILAVAARVTTFFSGGYVLPEPWLMVVLGLWLGVVLLRVLPPLPAAAIHLDGWLPAVVVVIVLLLGVWINGLVRRLWVIHTRARAMRGQS
ncbi:MAG: NnrS family protein [Magnetococcales bacterium]|nr:NnrS family protein [Magnetococcales bacterium]